MFLLTLASATVPILLGGVLLDSHHTHEQEHETDGHWVHLLESLKHFVYHTSIYKFATQRAFRCSPDPRLDTLLTKTMTTRSLNTRFIITVAHRAFT